jgi:hypothetical protein
MGTRIGVAARAEVMWASEGRSSATARRAGSGGFCDVGTIRPIALNRSPVALFSCGVFGSTKLFLSGRAVALVRGRPHPAARKRTAQYVRFMHSFP